MNDKVFNNYSKFYDIFYKDKDYIGETNYLLNLFRKYKLSKKTSLEFKYLKINDVNVEFPKSFNIFGFKISNKF